MPSIRPKSTAPNRLPWTAVHISDIHVGHGDDDWKANQRMVLAALEDDLRALPRRGIPTPQALLVTGDIAARGGKERTEYRDAAAVIERLRIAAGISTGGVWMVPGNHDVVRCQPTDPPTHRLVRDLRAGTDALDTSLATKQDAALLAARFDGYRRFARKNMGTVEGDLLLAWARRLELHDGLRLRVVGLNTALLCNDDEDERHLRLASRQLERLQGDGSEREIVLVLTHHPLTWLVANNEADSRSWLFRYGHIHLHGHLHVADANAVRGAAGETLITVTAGAVHNDRGKGEIPERHGYAAIVLAADRQGRVGVRVYPRVWTRSKSFRADVDVLPEGKQYNRYPLRIRVVSPPPPLPKRRGALVSLAAHLLRRLGQRRTAYPTDMSISELAEAGLLIEARMRPRGEPAKVWSVDDVVEAIGEQRGVLVLGEPGAGKTVIVYEVCRRIATRGLRSICLTVDVVDFVGPNAVSSLGDLVSRLASRTGLPNPIAGTVLPSSRPCLLVDGIDEAIAAGVSAAEIANALAMVAHHGCIFATCRSEVYERALAAVAPSDLFDRILDVQPWSLEGEFANFVNRLVASQRLRTNAITTQVGADPRLALLVTRPLFARMLTYVCEDGVLPASSTALYQDYLSKLACAADSSLRRTGCYSTPRALAAWRAVAWRVFRGDMSRAAGIPVGALLGLLEGEHALTADCAYRLLASIMDIGASEGRITGSFLHYSFYEFLIAQHVALGLTAAFSASRPDAASTLAKDLPQDVRRHLVRILRATATDLYAWPEWLAVVYRAAETQPLQARRTVCNLVAYLMCRLGVPAVASLRTLLESELDTSLRNSLSWALARVGDRDAALGWIVAASADAEVTSLNRGYLLYYFGDIQGSAPPYRDDAPYRPWAHTRAKLLEKLRANAGGRIPAGRRAIELFSFLDLLAVRQETQLAGDAVTVKATFDELCCEIDGPAREIVSEQIESTQ